MMERYPEPANQTSSGPIGTMAVSWTGMMWGARFANVSAGGTVTRFHAVPSQCTIGLGSLKLPWSPTAQTSEEERAATATSKFGKFGRVSSTGKETTVQALPSQCSIRGEL